MIEVHCFHYLRVTLARNMKFQLIVTPLLLYGSHSSQKNEVSIDCDLPLLLPGSHFSQKQEVLIDNDSPLSLLLLDAEISDPKKAHWTLQDRLLLFKNKLYILPGLFYHKVV